MGVVAPERERSAPAPPPGPPPERRRRPFRLLAALAFLVAGGALAWAALAALTSIIPSLNPFAGETVDRSPPALLRSLEDIGEYRAATAHYEQIVDVATDTALPSFLLGERTLFVAVGRVDAGVDLRAVGSGDVDVSGEAVTVTLPSARLYEPELDLEQSYVYDRQRGVVNRVAGLVGEEGGQEDVYRLAEQKLAEAAREDDALLRRAEANTEQMLASLLRSLGFERVDIRFG